jgi:ABC-type uncharacterized transport system permease subunit
MKYYYELSMDQFWALSREIILAADQQIGREKIVVITSEELEDYLQAFNNASEVDVYANNNNYPEIEWDGVLPIEEYVPQSDDPIFRGQVTY